MGRNRLVSFFFVLHALILSSSAQSQDSHYEISLSQAQVLPTEGGASGVTWSSDGTKLAAYSANGTLISTWDVRSGRKLAMIKRTGAIYSGNGLAFVNGGSAIATPAPYTNSADAAVSIFALQTGQPIQDLAGPFPDAGRPANSARTLAYSELTQTLAVASGYAKAWPVRLFSTRSWLQIGTLGNNATSTYPAANTISFSRDGHLLATGLSDGMVIIYDVTSLRTVLTVDAYSTERIGIGSTSISPDDSFIAIGAWSSGLSLKEHDREHLLEYSSVPVKIFRLSDGKLVSSLNNILRPVLSIEWSPNGKYIAFVDGQFNLRIWNSVGNFGSVQSIPLLPRSSSSLDFSPDGAHLAVCSGSSILLFSTQPN